MADIQTILADPDFQGLPLPEKNRVLMSVDPDYASLPGPERMKALNVIHYNPTLGPMPKEPEKLTLKSALRAALVEGPAIGLSGVGEMAIQAAKFPFDVARSAAQPPETGREIIASASGGPAALALERIAIEPQVQQFERAREAANRGETTKTLAHSILAGIPVIGPIIGGAAEQIQKPEDIPFVAGQLRAMPEAFRALPEVAKEVGEVGRRVLAPKLFDAAKGTSNFSAALEMGGRSAKGVSTYEEVASPILDDFRAEAARQGVTEKAFEGRKGYDVAKKVTEGVRTLYNRAYDSLVDPIRDTPAPEAAKAAAADVVQKMRSDTRLLDEIKGNEAATNALDNLAERVAKSETVGELDDLRVALNRMASKYEARTEAGQYESPLFQEALSSGADSIRSALYPKIAKAYPGFSEADIRELQTRHGAAIEADNLMETTRSAISKAASEEASRPGWWARLRGSAYRLTMQPKHAAGGLIERLFPPSDVELFNTRMKRVIAGATAEGGRVTPIPPSPEPRGTVTSEIVRPPTPALPPAMQEGIPPEPSPPPATPMPPSSFGPGGPPMEGPSPISVLQARSKVVRDPKTGRMMRQYLGGEEVKKPPAPEFSGKASDFVSPDYISPYQSDAMYHVTTRQDRVLLGGLKSRKQTKVVSLGGGAEGQAPDKVSVTFDENHAQLIHDRMRLAVQAAREEVTPRQILDHFNKEALLDDTEPRDTAEALGAPESTYEDWDAFDQWFNEEYLSAKDSYALLQELDDAVGKMYGGESEFTARVGFTASKAKMAQIDPDQIDIFKVEARKGAEAEHIADERELRFYPEDVRVVKPAEVPQPKTEARLPAKPKSKSIPLSSLRRAKPGTKPIDIEKWETMDALKPYGKMRGKDRIVLSRDVYLYRGPRKGLKAQIPQGIRDWIEEESPKSDPEDYRGVYLTSKEHALPYGGEGEDLMRVRIPAGTELIRDPFDTDSVFFKGDIPRNWIVKESK